MTLVRVESRRNTTTDAWEAHLPEYVRDVVAARRQQIRGMNATLGWNAYRLVTARWWTCRYCGVTDTGFWQDVADEKTRCLAHEEACPSRPNGQEATP